MTEKPIIVGQKERVSAWAAERVKRNVPWTNYEAIGLERHGELVAAIVIDNYVRGARCCMHIALEGRHSLSLEFLRVSFSYVFNQLKCQVAIALVAADNEASLKFSRHLGFQEACRIGGGSGDCDLVILTMPRKTCRWATR